LNLPANDPAGRFWLTTTTSDRLITSSARQQQNIIDLRQLLWMGAKFS
jgi:hypothetical protein